MDVTFKRTGERRYAVLVARADGVAQTMDPAPGYDDHIPHDLVHYVVEAELRLMSGVYGRAADGGGTFWSASGDGMSTRERARARRKQRRREQTLRRGDDERAQDMIVSERIAGLSDLAWRKRHGQRPDPARAPRPQPISDDDSARIERVLDRLNEFAPLWHALPVGRALCFTWPSLDPRVV